MDLPTYTSIWRIEKRLYKLYDFRLPMPVPVGQIAVFAAITVPYVILLTILGLPFNHTLFWLYVLPPGVITWLATRPVLESKRLPELIISQVRYLGEPGIWCRWPHWRRKTTSWSSARYGTGRRSRSGRRRCSGPRPPRLRRSGGARPAWRRPHAKLPRRPLRPSRRDGCRELVRRHTAHRGRAARPCEPWGGIAAGPEGPPSVMAADAPTEVAGAERQAPLRPEAAPAGRHAARAGLAPRVPGLPAGDEDKATRPSLPDALAAPPRPPAA